MNNLLNRNGLHGIRPVTADKAQSVRKTKNKRHSDVSWIDANDNPKTFCIYI